MSSYLSSLPTWTPGGGRSSSGWTSYGPTSRNIGRGWDDLEDLLLRSWELRGAGGLRLRVTIVFILAGWLIALGILGMAPLPELPINDKVMHFFGMGIATFLLYFIIEVPEASRRIWFYQRTPLIITLFFGFFVGGIVSEIVQSFLPWKTFQWGDILANLLGSSLALYGAQELLQRSRKRQMLSQLYRPIPEAERRRYDRFRPGAAIRLDDDEDEEAQLGLAPSSTNSPSAPAEVPSAARPSGEQASDLPKSYKGYPPQFAVRPGRSGSMDTVASARSLDDVWGDDEAERAALAMIREQEAEEEAKKLKSQGDHGAAGSSNSST